MDIIGAYSAQNFLFLFEGLWVTLEVSVISIILSFIIGGIIGVIRFTKITLLSPVLGFLVHTVRNIPLLLIIFFTYFALPEINIKLEIIPSAIAAITVYHSAMMSEIIRGGLKSIDKGQIEAARSTGLGYMQSMIYIIIPQALRRMVPVIVTQFITAIKDTSFAVIISLPELTHQSQIIYGQSFEYFWPIMIVVTLLYFSVNYSLSLMSRKLELKTEN